VSYYVSVRDGARYGLLLGPFELHEDALSHVDDVREAAERGDPWAHFYAFGTCKSETTEPGKLNDQFPDAPLERPHGCAATRAEQPEGDYPNETPCSCCCHDSEGVR
jgi:hypothetical protein